MGKTLGQVAEGQLVKLNESGKPVEFYVAKQNYESGLNGAGRTLLVRKDCYDNRVWDNGNVNAYASSDLDSWFNSTYKNMLDADIRSIIGTTKIRYTPGNGNKTVDTLERAVFALSATELGQSASWFNVEGSALPIANTLKVAYLNGNATTQWTRSPSANGTDYAVYLNSGGNVSNDYCNDSHGSRPAFTLPSSLYVSDDGTVVRYPSPSPITVPSLAMQGQSINASWSAVSADSYILQRKADSGEWTQVYAGPNTTFTDTAGNWSTVQYQVCGVFDGTNGAFAQSDSITVLAASALVISGTDGDLGTITADIPYSVATDTGNQISLTRTVNGAQVASLTVSTGFSYNIPVMDLPTGTKTIVITATVQASGGTVTVKRTWTYTKQAVQFPGSGGVAQLAKDGQNVFPMTLAEAVKAIGGPWGGNLSSALNKLAMAATYDATPIPKYSHVDVNLSTAQSGDIVNLPVNGVMVPHIVVQVGNPDPSMYDASCDGVWLLRQDIVENGQWNSSGVNTLSGATIMTTMQGYVDDYDPTVQAAIQTVKIPYCVGGGDTAVKTLENGLQCKMFPLSAQEIGCGDYPGTGTVPEDGAKLDYFPLGYANSTGKRLSKYNGENSDWFTRSQLIINSSSVWLINSGEGFTNDPVTDSLGIRPCFTLPVTFAATYYVDTEGNVYPSQEYTTAGDFYDLWGNVIPTVKIATGSYTGTGTYGASNSNSITAPFSPKIAFITPESGANDNIAGGFINFLSGYYSVFHVSGTSPAVGFGRCSVEENTAKWWATGSTGTTSNVQNVQFNVSGVTYSYIIFG